jgi:hypothetical protein
MFFAVLIGGLIMVRELEPTKAPLPTENVVFSNTYATATVMAPVGGGRFISNCKDDLKTTVVVTEDTVVLSGPNGRMWYDPLYVSEDSSVLFCATADSVLVSFTRLVPHQGDDEASVGILILSHPDGPAIVFTVDPTCIVVTKELMDRITYDTDNLSEVTDKMSLNP